MVGSVQVEQTWSFLWIWGEGQAHDACVCAALQAHHWLPYAFVYGARAWAAAAPALAPCPTLLGTWDAHALGVHV